MNTATRVDIPILSVMEQATLVVTVTGVTVWKIRASAAMMLLKTAARLLGTQIHVDFKETL